MNRLKPIARQVIPWKLYLWLAHRWRDARRLFIYPGTARIGAVDYDDYWEAKAGGKAMGSLSPYRLARAEALRRIIKPGSKVLDLGVGDGAILKYLVDKHGVDGYGLDISPQAVAFCRANGLNVALADINKPIGADIDGHYDAIIMTEIIEHIPDPERLLNTLRARADLLVVSIPNTGFYQHRLRLLLGKFPLQWVVTPGEHLRYWTVRDFRWWAGQMGFAIRAQDGYVGFPVLRRWWPNLWAMGVVYALADSE